MNTKEERHCLECSEVLIGRSDKKFCSDQCRNCYNNRRNSDDNNLMRNVNNILRRNRRIMQSLSPAGKATVPRHKMIDMGYNFNFHTNEYHTRKGAVYYFCYEYGYIAHGSDLVTIVLRKEKELQPKEQLLEAINA